jgi:PadR family transcriptional regulator PadR
MEASGLDAWITQLRRGLIELCVLAALSDDEAYGYQIVERLNAIEGLQVTESTIYPVLARLARDRCLLTRTASSPHGPARRYYRLADAGRRRLDEMTAHWRTMQQSVNQLLPGDTR